MISYPRISIITPSFNQGHFLEKTIKSVLNQNYPDIEYIIIDGGSTDQSLDIIKKYERHLSYWVSEADNGQSHAFNKGLEHVSGDIIGWLNSDDIYLENCLFQVADYFNKHPLVDIVFSDYYFIDENDNIIKIRKEIPFRYKVYLWTQDCYHANCAGFFRRSVFDTVGGLNEALHYSMDYEYYLRCAESGARFGHQRGYWGAYRLHKKSKSINQYASMQKESKFIAKQFYPSHLSTFDAALRKHAFSLFRFSWKFLIGSYFRSVLPHKRIIVP